MMLYEKGMNDSEISREIGKNHATIRYWRNSRGLKSNNVILNLSRYRHEQRLKYYKEGMNDREIGEKVGLASITIFQWRKKFNLPAQKRYTDADEILFWKYYNDGLNDVAIANKFNSKLITYHVISKWRHNNKLKPNWMANATDRKLHKRTATKTYSNYDYKRKFRLPIQLMEDMIKEGFSYDEIAHKINADREPKDWLSRYDIEAWDMSRREPILPRVTGTMTDIKCSCGAYCYATDTEKVYCMSCDKYLTREKKK